MPCRVAVVGRSMEPTLHDGDHVLVLPARGRGLRRGDLVVVRDPTAPDRWVIKRLAALPGENLTIDGRILEAGAGLLVLGDNARASTDSRGYGPVDLAAVRGRAWYRYAPAQRAGWLRRPPRSSWTTRPTASRRRGGTRRWRR